jgi:disintegrin and metalloproteinase domain-containing protein 17
LSSKRSKRSLDSLSDALDRKQITFRSYGRQFDLQLQQTREILADDFKAFAVDASGRRKQITVDIGEFYKGHLNDELNSKVTAHIDPESGLMTAAIYDLQNKQTYFVEPIGLAIPDATADNQTMIVYRPQDFVLPQSPQSNGNNSFCAYIKVDDDFDHRLSNESEVRVRKRHIFSDNFWDETQKEEPTKCSLKLVADHTFFEQMGGGDLKKTINLLITLVQRVNEIFEATEWKYSPEDDDVLRGYGFLVGELVVHEQYSESYSDNLPHYNANQSAWQVRDLLEAFARSTSHRSFCLAHLFTHQSFSNGVLGLAYVASPRKHSFGGVCSPWYDREGRRLYLNTGLSTTQNTFGQRVSMRQAVLVASHELGHNWGAEHDPIAVECSPKPAVGGSFVMNTFAVSSYEPNNARFSACSRRSIKSVLRSKSPECFSRPKRTFCGNGVREPGEQCDAGLAAGPTGDACCTASCRLKPNAMCSDRNQPCCVSCAFASPTLQLSCRDANELDCQAKAICNGSSAACPPPVALADGSGCPDDGKCRAGRCVPFCETQGKLSCLCESPVDACLKCCRESINSTCRPWPNALRLRDGTACVRGLCNNGRCVQMANDHVERFWRIIDGIHIDSFQQFLKDNLVGCVIIVSLFIFIPACYFVEVHDRTVKRQYQGWQKQQIQRSLRSQSTNQPRSQWQQRWQQQWNQQRRAPTADVQHRQFRQMPDSVETSQFAARTVQPPIRANRTSFSNRPNRGRIHEINNLSPYQLYDPPTRQSSAS